MNKAVDQHSGGGDARQNATTQQNSGTEQGQVKISEPHVERAEGPFEHSGETSGWTEEERKEKRDQEQQ